MTTTSFPTHSQVTSRFIVAGAVAGALGGMAMAMMTMLIGIADEGFWAPVRGITSVAFGDQHYGASFAAGPVLAGAMGHMMNSAVLGIVLAAILKTTGLRGLPALATGAAFGLLLWVAMFALVLPNLQESGLLANAVPQWAWALGHMAFGLVTAVVIQMTDAAKR